MKHTSNKWRLAMVGALSTAAIGGNAFGQSADSLIDKLVDKGVLSVNEAKELREESDKDFTRAYAVKSGMPEWVTALKLNGDVRLRYENFYFNNDQMRRNETTAVDRNRFRYRLRFGVTATLMDNVEAGFRLTSSEASGAFGGDPISGNTSFNGNGAKKGIYLDLAYGRWNALNNPDWTLTLTGGKMENPFAFSDLVFDGDYTPEGAALQLTRNLSDKHALKFNGGGFVLNEIGNASDDSYLFGGQLRLESAWNPKWQSSLGAGWLAIMGNDRLSTALVPNQNQGNSRDANGNLLYNYNPVVVDASVTHTLESFPLYKAAFPIKLAADYVYNPVVANDQYAWSAGLTLGKSGKKGLWDLSYRYKYVGADSWYEELVDSDTGAFYGRAPVAGLGTGYRAGTNVRGHVLKLQYSPLDSTTIAVTYLMMDLINSYPIAGAQSAESFAGRLQVDVSWKF